MFLIYYCLITFIVLMYKIKNICKVHHHINIIRFYGITQDSRIKTYYMILQFANNGDLRSYFHNYFSELDWPTKIRMAMDIANGINCLHNANIVHRDLHDKNILVDNGKLMISDFGLSKSLGNSSKSVVGGLCAFCDPKYLQNPFLYKRDKPSDIYSLGVLFWEISSGIPPFKNITDQIEISLGVISGKRETPINGTPVDFVNLYCDAWNNDPNLRPNITEIRHKLNQIQLDPVYHHSEYDINIDNSKYDYADFNSSKLTNTSSDDFKIQDSTSIV